MVAATAKVVAAMIYVIAEATTWPDVAVVVAMCLFMAFVVWQNLRYDDE